MPTDSTIEFLSPFAPALLAGIGGIALAVLLLLRLVAGPPAAIARRRGLFLIRTFLLLILLALLLNPVRVDETPGPMEHPDLFYLLDTSRSMRMGNDSSRWEHVTNTMQQAEELVRDRSQAKIQTFRFGHKFAAVESSGKSDRRSKPAGSPKASPEKSVNRTEPENLSALPADPSDTDTQLVPALRQLSSRFGRSPPAAIVLFSDGQVRDPNGVTRLAEYYDNIGVPIHVVPVGEPDKGGDIAVVGVVAPDRVRKQSKVDVQVFLRSFGYDGRRSLLQLRSVGDGNAPPQKLAELPIILQSGIQSRTLSFRSDLKTRQLRVSLPVQPDETSSENNSFETGIVVDRTKIRVLYVEGNGRQLYSARRGGQTIVRGPFSDLQEALVQDPDVECLVVAPVGRTLVQRANTYSATVRGFPETVAELAAFDAIILSNVSSEFFTEEQLQWIEQWVSRRGAGLCMLGGKDSFSAGGWGSGILSGILPVELESGDDWDPDTEVALQPGMVSTSHPIWHLVDDAKLNRNILQSIPPIFGANRFLRVKPNLATVLATTGPLPTSVETENEFGSGGNGVSITQPNGFPTPAIVAGRYGKGRTMVMSSPITIPWAQKFVTEWGEGDNRYYAKFWQNVIYWLTENSSIGRRRLIVSADKRFYRPGEKIRLRASAFDEGANRTTDYRVVAMIEPQLSLSDLESDYSPVRWPESLTRESGEDGPFVAWGEEFDLPGQTGNNLQFGDSGYGLEMQISDVLDAGAANQSLRVELTAYEDFTQVDSTSLAIQILHDPFEQQNPLPNHELLKQVAQATHAEVLSDSQSLANVINNLPVKAGEPTLEQSPLWSQWWLLAGLLILLTAEWLWRRSIGLA